MAVMLVPPSTWQKSQKIWGKFWELRGEGSKKIGFLLGEFFVKWGYNPILTNF